jgi:hypothetical protein
MTEYSPDAIKVKVDLSWNWLELIKHIASKQLENDRAIVENELLLEKFESLIPITKERMKNTKLFIEYIESKIDECELIRKL